MLPQDKCTMNHSRFVVSNQLEEFIRLQKVNLADCGEGVPMGESKVPFVKTREIYLTFKKEVADKIRLRKTARIRNRYNQVPHLSQDTKWESNKITINITNKSQEVSPFPSGDHIRQQ